jgi:tetratricopeptide (TPR) repeat protein
VSWQTAIRPYVGLEAFSEQDAPFFYGRKALQEIIISNLRSTRLTLLFGASGVGKSSILRAGVLPELRRAAAENLSENRAPEFAAAMFNNWRDDPLAGLVACVRASVERALDRPIIEPSLPGAVVADTFRAWADRLGGKQGPGELFIILDQFEDYFLYHGHQRGNARFEYQLRRLINQPGLKLNFIISIRDDALFRIERLRDTIPGLLDNCLEIKHLSAGEAASAIEEPIKRYNERYCNAGEEISLESGLVKKVLEEVRTARLPRDTGAQGAAVHENIGPAMEDRLEAPVLELVMTKLWDEEMRSGSRILRCQTLDRLKGARHIWRTHLEQIMRGGLTWRDRRNARRLFRELVSPSERKIALSAPELARATRVDQGRIDPLLEKLSGEGIRILRPTTSRDDLGYSRYEVFHDVLCKPIMEWRIRAEERAKVATWFLLSLGVLLLASAFGILFRETERARRDEQHARSDEQHAREEAHLAASAGNINGQVLATLYQDVILGSQDPNEMTRNFWGAWNTLNESLAHYRRERDATGEGITLNNIAGLCRHLAMSYSHQGSYDGAQPYYRQAECYYQEALDRLEQGLGRDYTDVATSLNDWGALLADQGKYAETEPLLKRSLTILEKKLAPDDRYLADGILNMAECQNSQGKYAEAEPLYNRALEIRKAKLPTNHPDLAESYCSLGRLYLEQGKYVTARPLLETALTIWQKQDESGAMEKSKALNLLACLSQRMGRYVEAVQYLKQVRDSDAVLITSNHILEADDLEYLGLYYAARTDPQAETVLTIVLSLREKTVGKSHPATAHALSNLAAFYSKLGQVDRAEPLFKRAEEIQQGLPDSPGLALTLQGLARIYSGRGNYTEAETLLKRARAIQEKAIPTHPDLATTLNDYGDILRKTGREDEASQVEERAKQILDGYQKENAGN